MEKNSVAGLLTSVDDLFSTQESRDEAKLERVINLPPGEISDFPNHPFKVRMDEEMQQMAESVKEHGVLVPIIVNKNSAHEKYLIVAGERRFRAAQRAELTEIPAIVKNFGEQEILEIALIENVQRSDLNVLEEAKGYKMLMERFGYTAEELAKRMGKSRPQIANCVRLLNLPAEVLEMVAEGKLSAGHVRPLLTLSDEAWQKQMAEDIYHDALSVRQVENMVNQLKLGLTSAEKSNIAAEKEQAKYDQQLNTELLLVQEQLKEVFKTKVTIKNRRGKGKIEIDFYSEDDLKRIIDLLGGEFY